MNLKIAQLITVGFFLITPLISLSQSGEFSILVEEDREGILIIFHDRLEIQIIDYYDFPYIRQVHTASNDLRLIAHIRANYRYSSDSFITDDSNMIPIEDRSSVDYRDQPNQQLLTIANRRIVLRSRSFLSRNENIAIAFRRGAGFHSGYFDQIADNSGMLSIADFDSYIFCRVLEETDRLERIGLENRQIIGISTRAAMAQHGLACDSNLELTINDTSDTSANINFDIFRTALNSNDAINSRSAKIQSFDLVESKKQLILEYYYNVYDDEFIAKALYDGFIESDIFEKIEAGSDPSVLEIQQLGISIIASLTEEGLRKLESSKIRAFIEISSRALSSMSPEDCITFLFGSEEILETEIIFYKELNETDLESVLSLTFDAAVVAAKGVNPAGSLTRAQTLAAERVWNSAFEERLSEYPDLQAINAVYDDPENASDKATCDASFMIFQSVLDVEGRPGDWAAKWIINQN